MKKILFILFTLALVAAQAQTPEKRFVGNCQFTGFSLVSDSTYLGNITSFTDRFGDGYNASMITSGYEILDGRGLVYVVDSVLSASYVSASVRVVAKVNRGFAPFGSGQVYNPTNLGLIPASSVEQAGLSPVSKARIDRHNVVQLDSFVRMGIDTIYSITAVPDTSGISPNIGDAFINATADTLGLYSGAAWVLFFGGAAPDSSIFATVTYVDSLHTVQDDSLAQHRTELNTLDARLDTSATAQGTSNRIPRFSATRNLVDSWLLQSGSRLVLDGQKSFGITGGTDAQRPTGSFGDFWSNSTTNTPQWYRTSQWWDLTLGKNNVGTGYVPYWDGDSWETGNLYRISSTRFQWSYDGGFQATNAAAFLGDYKFHVGRTDNGSPESSLIIGGYNSPRLYFAAHGSWNAPVIGVTSINGLLSFQNHGSSVSRLTVRFEDSPKVVIQQSSPSPDKFTGNGSNNQGLIFTNASDEAFYNTQMIYSTGQGNTTTGGLAIRNWSRRNSGNEDDSHSYLYIGNIDGTHAQSLMLGVRIDSLLSDSILAYPRIYGPWYLAYAHDARPTISDVLVKMTKQNFTISADTVIVENLTDDATPDFLVSADNSGVLTRMPYAAPAYASLKKTSTTTLTLGVTDLRISGMTSGVAQNVTLTDSTATVGVAGTYEISYSGSVSLSPGGAGTYLASFSLYQNSTELVETTSDFEIVAAGAGNYYSPIAGSTIMSLSASDVISLRYNGTTSTPSELRNISITIKKI